MWLYHPPNLPNLDSWGAKQIVLPLFLRKSITEVSQESFGGHSGVGKTYHKLPNQFFWPKMKADTAEVARTCSVCQVSVNQIRLLQNLYLSLL